MPKLINEPTPFGLLMRKIRKEKHIAAKVMCDDLGFSRQRLSNLELGKAKYGDRLLERLATYYGLIGKERTDFIVTGKACKKYEEISISGKYGLDRELIVRLTTTIEQLSEDTKLKILNILKEAV